MKLMLWDFDGTLARREGMWSGALTTLVNRLNPEYKITIADIRPSLQAGFPWHFPETNYGIRSADRWWADIEPVFKRAYLNAGVKPDHATLLSKSVRSEYTKVEYWAVYNDVFASLEYFQSKGWRHYILSNHVPELESLVIELGIAKYFEQVFNSAHIGLEKPNPDFFQHVLSQVPEHDEIWMIGDSYIADVQGAETVNIPAILVRKSNNAAALQCKCLADLPNIIFKS